MTPTVSRWERCIENGADFFQLKIEHVRLLYSTKHNQDRFLNIFQPTLVKQIHSSAIIDVDVTSKRTGDGLISHKREVTLGIKIADCLPLYLFNEKTICIVHCGWRGIINGIVKTARKLLGTYTYALGACIGPCCYKIRQDVRELFVHQYPEAVKRKKEGWFLDLKVAVQKDLDPRRMLASLDLCTKCHPEYFYSHRGGDIHERNFAVCRHSGHSY